MASGAEIDENGDTKGNMWVLEQKLDQPMDEEAGRLKNMYREKVRFNSQSISLLVNLWFVPSVYWGNFNQYIKGTIFYYNS